jgi:hypothetical protein
MPNRMSQILLSCLSAVLLLGCLDISEAIAQSARDVRGAAAVEPLQGEPPAKIVVDPPLASPLFHGRVVIQYRTENLHVAPVFGSAALAVSPRVGHVHVSVDDAQWVWVDASGEPIILNGLPPGPHKVLIQLETANHQPLDQAAVNFVIPDNHAAPSPASLAHAASAVQPPGTEPPARIIVESPNPEPLSRGVVFIQYRAEHLRILPVFGPAALAISPRIGHIHVTVDDATWHWADASGVPIIINGLAPGPHKLLIQLVNANHQPIDQNTVQVTVPAPSPRPAS